MVILAEDVRRRYGGTAALDGVSLAVNEGEVFALVGPNGAGKTTLVRALTGTTVVDGEVSVLGEAPDEVDPERVGLLPQEFDPAERLTARELVAYYAGLYETARDPDAVLADVGLEGADTRKPYEDLSGGQKRRTCVATALVNDPDVLFLDEPTTGIDPAGRRTLWSLLSDLADGGTTVLLTTHYMEEAETLADRVGLLADGQLVAVGAPGDLVASHGGDSRLELDIPADAEGAAATALEMAGYQLLPDETALAVTGIDPREIGAVVETLEDERIPYGAITWKQPDLEDVYLSLTGTEVTAGGEPVPRRRGRMSAQGGGS
ncbi:ABC transporter ATP-binding protein [Halobacteriales archaeon QS_4_70_19]|nr:MAG: ABC transporter ATP-binding protein [Halobacteriales archaeon QS_4_70_19]